MRLLVSFWNQVWHTDLESVLNFDQGFCSEPVLFVGVLLRIFNSHLDIDECLSSFQCVGMNARAVESGSEHLNRVIKPVSDSLTVQVRLILLITWEVWPQNGRMRAIPIPRHWSHAVREGLIEMLENC